MTSPAGELRAYLDDALSRYRPQRDPATSEPTFAARREFQQLLHEGGWAAPGWPVEHGGRGLSIADQVACDAVLALAGAPIPAGVLGLRNVGPTLIDFGAAEQRRSLAGILDATEIWCQGFSEPDNGSDLAGLRTRAVPDASGGTPASGGVAGGGGFVINGQKTWTSNGMDATHCMLLTRTDPDAPAHRGISALLVPLDVPGIQRRPIRMISGEAEFAELFFTDVRVPRSALLGPLHGGWGVTVRTLKHERAGVIGQAAGLERRARRAIGDAGGARLAATVREQLARRYVEARVVGLLGADTLARAERGMDIGSAQALIKLAWGMADRQLGETAFDAFGPAAAAGVRNDLTRNLLYARSSTIAAGTTEILKNLVADRVLELPR